MQGDLWHGEGTTGIGDGGNNTWGVNAQVGRGPWVGQRRGCVWVSSNREGESNVCEGLWHGEGSWVGQG